MTAVCPDDRIHSAYFEFNPHTTTDKAHDCAFCHEHPEVLCEGCEGQPLGPPGASFIPQETIDRVLALGVPTSTETPAPTPAQPGFELLFGGDCNCSSYLSCNTETLVNLRQKSCRTGRTGVEKWGYSTLGEHRIVYLPQASCFFKASKLQISH